MQERELPVLGFTAVRRRALYCGVIESAEEYLSMGTGGASPLTSPKGLGMHQCALLSHMRTGPRPNLFQKTKCRCYAAFFTLDVALML